MWQIKELSMENRSRLTPEAQAALDAFKRRMVDIDNSSTGSGPRSMTAMEAILQALEILDKRVTALEQR